MAPKTWADSENFDPTRGRVECPCCGCLRAQDMILRMPVPPDVAQEKVEEIVAHDRIPWTDWPRWACTAHLSTLHRHELAPPGVPGRR